jgi:hypothetical protein
VNGILVVSSNASKIIYITQIILKNKRKKEFHTVICCSYTKFGAGFVKRRHGIGY